MITVRIQKVSVCFLYPVMEMTEVVVLREKKCYIEKKKEADTMMSIAKPREQAFVLSSKKANTFLNQNNKQFKNARAKFEKFNKQKSHSIAKNK